VHTCRQPFGSVVALAAALLAACAASPPAPPSAAPATDVRQVLAPSGKLRVGLYAGSPTSIVRDGAGERGVGFELGREFARRLGVPFEPVVFPRNADVQDAVKGGRVDVTFTNATPARAKDMDFTQPFLEVEQGFLVPANSPIRGIAEVDRPGVRVGVSEGSSSEATLAKQFSAATIVRTSTLQAASAMLASGALAAFATNKAILNELSDSLPGSRILDGGFGREQFAAGIPKGREAGMPFARQFIDDAKSEGLVAGATRRAGVRGTTVPATP
jgi:polar amino acid transport system substrate-binding protein